MMALDLLDTKWVGVIQPDPDSAQAGEVETEHILAPADGRAAASFRSAPVPRLSSLACSKTSALLRSMLLHRLNTQAGAHRRRDTSPARQPLPETSLGPRAADSCKAILTAAGRLRGSCRSAAPSCPRPRGSVPNPVHPRMTACAARRTRSAIAALNFTLVAGRETCPWKGLLTGSPCTFSWCSPWRPGRSSRSAPAHGRGARCAWSRPSRRAQRPPVSPVRRARDRARHRPRASPR